MSNDIWTPRSQKGIYLNIALWTFGILALCLLIAVAAFGIRWATAPAKGKLSAREQINSGSFRIAAYNHFFDACAGVQSLEGQIDAQQQELKSATTPDDKSRIGANIAGLRGARAEGVADYNADARKSYTLGQFRASGLPFQLPTDPYTGGTHTSCTG